MEDFKRVQVVKEDVVITQLMRNGLRRVTIEEALFPTVCPKWCKEDEGIQPRCAGRMLGEDEWAEDDTCIGYQGDEDNVVFCNYW